MFREFWRRLTWSIPTCKMCDNWLETIKKSVGSGKVPLFWGSGKNNCICWHGTWQETCKRKLPSMRIELISEDVYSFAEVISEYETSVLTVKLRGRIWELLEAQFVGCMTQFSIYQSYSISAITSMRKQSPTCRDTHVKNNAQCFKQLRNKILQLD